MFYFLNQVTQKWVIHNNNQAHLFPDIFESKGSPVVSIQTCPQPLLQHMSVLGQSLSELHISTHVPAAPAGTFGHLSVVSDM